MRALTYALRAVFFVALGAAVFVPSLVVASVTVAIAAVVALLALRWSEKVRLQSERAFT